MRYLVIVLLIVCSLQGFGQSYLIRGSVTDTLNSTSLYRASIVAIRTKDSVIESFTRTGPDGRFELKVSSNSKYLLRITFPSFVDYLGAVNVKSQITDLGDLPMVSKEHLLKEFVLTKNISAIKIKGDTTEYVADSFKVKENATVEDLLKKLPGIQVDKDGNITAQGETVQKVLVDGEEFFSDDPKVVTKGLQANAVDKVQVYNKKSEQAEFTGIDDGQKTKTINLELKEDKKKGYFGKLDAGGGTDGYFQDQGMINAFKAKRQFSAFAIMSNTDKIGLGWEDNNKFGSGSSTMITDDGNIFSYSSNSNADFGGGNNQYNGQGLPQTWTGGAHFADKWNDDKSHVTSNYRYAMQNVDLAGSTTTQNVLPDNKGFISQQNKTQFSKGERHGLDFMYEWKLDSNTTIKLTADGGYKQSNMLTNYNTNTFNQDTGLINTNKRNITSNYYSDYVNADLVLKKKFKKKGRTISLDFKENYKETSSNGILNSATNVYSVGKTDTATADQKKVTQSNTLAFYANATYTEPLSKKVYLELNYGVTVNNSTSANYSYDTAGKGFSNKSDSLYSSDYKYNILTNKGGANLKFVYKKVNFSFGGNVSDASYLQTDVYHGDTSHRYNYVNFFPRANLTYKISNQTSFTFNYWGNTQQPTINQVQPLRQNTDPLNITIGNPGLKQEFTNTFSVNFNDYKMLSSRYLYGNFSFSTMADAISTKQISEYGVNTIQYINVNGNYSGYGYFGGGQKIKKLDVMLGLQTNMSINHVNNIVLTDTSNAKSDIPNNHTDYNTYSFGPYINYEKEKKFEFTLQPEITYNYNKSTISTFSTSYWSTDLNFNGTVQLPWKCEIGTTVDVMIRQKTATFPVNNNVVKWNAHVERKFLKNSQLVLKASVLDILNQNIGYSRTAQAGMIIENNYNTIRRYGMLQLIWNFTHTPAGVKPAVEGPVMNFSN